MAELCLCPPGNDPSREISWPEFSREEADYVGWTLGGHRGGILRSRSPRIRRSAPRRGLPENASFSGKDRRLSVFPPQRLRDRSLETKTNVRKARISGPMRRRF